MQKCLQAAYQRPTCDEAKRELLKIHKELKDTNQSAASSLAEGFDETLTLHRLGMFPVLGLSFKTTNCLESINSMAEQRCAKVDYWKNSSQEQRWLMAALTDIEPRLRKVRGWKHLGKLRKAMLYSLDEKQELEDVGETCWRPVEFQLKKGLTLTIPLTLILTHYFYVSKFIYGVPLIAFDKF